ncbi:MULTISPECIES: hypothetical protein [unclassified Yoonia]|uniref:hypothetical protein n=1 Tax=unclassified Yoonia TaxID=2629118 RepID=UPI002AFEBFF0|nr:MULTISPECIES: hypothetical protein [unclassified Yoonia]
MERQLRSRQARAQTLLAGMPDVPEDVRQRFATAFLIKDPAPRGMPKALQAFYAHMRAVRRVPAQVRADDFIALSASRTAHRVLLGALRQFAPEVPLAAARTVSKHWDHWLNSTYNKKPRSRRVSTRVALLPDDWPAAWQVGVPLLEQVVRVEGKRLRTLTPKTRENILQAVGMLAASRLWAEARGVVTGDTFSDDLFEAFVRFMLLEREASSRTVADYLERIQMFAQRAQLLVESGRTVLSDLIGTLRADAADHEPTKRAKVRAFRREFTLSDMLRRAIALGDEAAGAPDGTFEAERKRRAAVILALLVNTADRQRDMSSLVIGETIQRNPDGLWEIRIRQAKTGRRKELGPLWLLTSVLIDAHVLAGRPHYLLDHCLNESTGSNLLSLTRQPFSTYYPTAILREEFGISGHLVRTLVTDLIRNERPDSAWAAQHMLGHSGRWMQQTYRSDFRATASVKLYHDVLLSSLDR